MTWDIPGVGKLLAGIKAEVLKVDGENPVIHVQFPPGTPKERSASFAEAMRKEFPADIKIVYTTPGVKISVLRPKVFNFTISDCELSVRELKARIGQIIDQKSDVVNIQIRNTRWVEND